MPKHHPLAHCLSAIDTPSSHIQASGGVRPHCVPRVSQLQHGYWRLQLVTNTHGATNSSTSTFHIHGAKLWLGVCMHASQQARHLFHSGSFLSIAPGEDVSPPPTNNPGR